MSNESISNVPVKQEYLNRKIFFKNITNYNRKELCQ